jgi:hypothetical protein
LGAQNGAYGSYQRNKIKQNSFPDDLPLVAHNQGIMSSLHHAAD